jgi:hypothetical protein
VRFDNEAIKNWKLAAALLHTFAAVGKSMSCKQLQAAAKQN